MTGVCPPEHGCRIQCGESRDASEQMASGVAAAPRSDLLGERWPAVGGELSVQRG
jgi:hypothetical protein